MLIRYQFLAACLLSCLLGVQGALAEPPSSGFNLNAQDRYLARWFYNIVYRSSEETEADWTGDVDACIPGETSQAFEEAVIRRVNYYRAMAGVPAEVTVNSDYSAKAQEAALMMSAEGALSHTPDAGWACYSSDGDAAAGKSNLSLGRSGWDAVSGQMRDNGDNNAAVGHRRWILYPQTREMGSGDIPAGSAWEANALWVFDDHTRDARPEVRDGFVSWPPPGYVPHQVVYPRWSFSYPDADLSAASVTLFRDGANVDVTMEAVTDGFGENTLVWIPEDQTTDDVLLSWPRPDADILYDVVISGVEIDGQTQEPFSYQVNVIDPLAAGPDEALASIDGPALMAVSTTGSFTYTEVPHALGYQWRHAKLDSGPWVEGAEANPIDLVDATSASYPLITGDLAANGAASFHLAQPDYSEQSFQFAQAILLGDAAELVFYSRLGWATADQVAAVRISVDDGVNWVMLWQQLGTGDAGEPGFTRRSLSLDAYAGRTVHIRFSYGVDGTYYNGSDAGVGFYIDDIQVTDAARAGPWTTTSTGLETQLDFVPIAEGDYGLQVRPLPWAGFPGTEWGPVYEVQVISDCSQTSKDWVYKAYIGYYSRCPDQTGLLYWCNRLDLEGGGTDLGPIIAAFGTSQEYSDRFSALSDAELLGNLYQNMFVRDVEPDGLTFYLGLLEQWRALWRMEHAGSNDGATEYALSRIALDVLNGAQGDDAVTLDGKLNACPVY